MVATVSILSVSTTETELPFSFDTNARKAKAGLATFRRKIRVFGRWRTVAAKAKARRAGRGGRERRRLQAGGYRLALFARAFPMLMRLSPITPSPTQRRMPLSPL